MPAILALGAISLAACSTAGPVPLVESGYTPGALGLAAIDRGDWQAAERLLNSGRADEADPARLINLGHVYMETGRTAEALSAWRLALASGRHHEIQTRDGRETTTDAIAREALARYRAPLRTAAR